MKTTNFRLLATMFTLAAVITITIPANAQRRSTERSNVNRTEKSAHERRDVVQKKNTTQNHNSRPANTTRNKVNKSYDVKRYNSSAQSNKSSRNGNAAISKNNNRNSNTYRNPNPASANSRREVQDRNRSLSVQSNSKRPDVSERGRISYGSSATRINSENNSSDRRNQSRSVSKGYDRPEERGVTGRTRIDENDRRYTPNRNYKGSSKYWSDRDRPSKMNYNHTDRNFWKNYNYNHYSHWDRRWENYRWNAGSWRDYYRGYNPYSFRYSKYYYHSHRYGHVLRKFVYQPMIFVHNHQRYYCYDGHFFRYHRGIGYVLVDMPYGFAFDYLPVDFERVYINGYLYFRIGNLFFEYSDYGYRLIHYPERYFAINFEISGNDWTYGY